MTDMFLTSDELIAMTGRKQYSAQAKALTHLGVIHKIRAVAVRYIGHAR